MGKSKKSKLQNQDAYSRLNFLYQAAHSVLVCSPKSLALVRYYSNTMKDIAKKLVLRLDPSIKRNICRYCHLLLIPGVTCTIRTRSKPEKCRIVTCKECRTTRKFLCRDGYKLWAEKGQESQKLDSQGMEETSHDTNYKPINVKQLVPS